MTKEFEIKYYNQTEIWKNYDNIRERDRARMTIDLIPKGVRSVLDIGCGNGAVTNMIHTPFVVGLDLGKIPLSNIKTNAIQASVDALPIKNKKFDLVIITEVLEHLDDDTYIKAIEELHRLDAKYYLITVPFKESLDINLCKCSACGNLFNLFYHYRRFDDAWFTKEFKDYSLEKNQYASYRCFASERITKLRHKFDIYQYSDYAICNKCGNPPIRPKTTPIRYILSGLRVVDCRLRAILNIRKPYHQMILLRRKKD